VENVVDSNEMFQLQLSLQLKSHKKQDSADELMRQLGSKLDDTYNPKKKRKSVQGLLQSSQSTQASGGIRI